MQSAGHGVCAPCEPACGLAPLPALSALRRRALIKHKARPPVTRPPTQLQRNRPRTQLEGRVKLAIVPRLLLRQQLARVKGRLAGPRLARVCAAQHRRVEAPLEAELQALWGRRVRCKGVTCGAATTACEREGAHASAREAPRAAPRGAQPPGTAPPPLATPCLESGAVAGACQTHLAPTSPDHPQP